jgi:hypothetical protein
MAVSYQLWSFGTYIFPTLVSLDQEKSGSPVLHFQQRIPAGGIIGNLATLLKNLATGTIQ